MNQVYIPIKQLLNYAKERHLIEQVDEIWARNGLLALLRLSDYEDPGEVPAADLETILATLNDYAVGTDIVAENSVAYRDLFDTSLMGVLTPRPSEVIARFNGLYKESPEAATEYFYNLCRDNDYIRTYRVKKDMKWVTPSVYGDVDVTINLSKPEKDPKAIAAAKLLPQGGYPKCLLCRENEGYAGSLKSPARQNIRLIPLTMAGKQWYLQYSPYVYYNEHCIVLSGEHTPMKIDRSSFVKLLDFVGTFPHYFLGSNADLPIVGGSILTHDHMQGGHYTFAMAKAPIEQELKFEGYGQVKAGIVKWPMSVIRLRSSDREALIDLSDKILLAWRAYSDASVGILAETEGEPHNTITPIARMRDGEYELDLVLRCNVTSEEHPMGVFHPHEELHHIKKENIGLIEVMGLAVLPARLKNELLKLKDCILAGKDPATEPDLEKHAEWVASFRDRYVFTEENTLEILQAEVGKVFVKVLECAGVYKCTPEGRAAFNRFVSSVGGH